VVKQSKPIPPFSKGEVLHGESLLAVITVVKYSKSIPPFEKKRG
jgi:hypothetical protein